MSAGVVIVQQYQRMVVQRFGTYIGLRRPGFHFLIPVVYNGTKVDLRERVARVPTQKYITSDNVVVDMDFVIYYRVLENVAERAVLEVQNFELGGGEPGFRHSTCGSWSHYPVGSAGGKGKNPRPVAGQDGRSY